VLVRDCSGWPRLANCLRVTVGTPEENDRFLDALGEAVVELEEARPRP
jgi:histidinol-phosphate aminotransferase